MKLNTLHLSEYTARAAALILLTVIITGLLAAQAAGSGPYTIGTAMSTAIGRNPALRQAVASLADPAARLRIAQSRLYPVADASAGYTRLGPLPEIAFGGVALPLYPADNYDIHVGIHHTLFDFGKRNSAIDLAVSASGTAEDRVEILRRDIALQTARSFYSILVLRRSVTVQDEQIRSLDEHRKTINTKIVSGTATDFDLLTTQVRIASARNVRIGLDAALVREEITFRKLLDLPADSPVDLQGVIAADSLALPADTLVAAALSRSPEIKASDDLIRTETLRCDAARLDDRPQLRAFAEYGFRNGFFPNLDAWRGNYAAGVEFEVPIFNGFLTDAMVGEAEAGLNTAREARKDLESTIRSQVLQALADVRAAAQKKGNSAFLVEQAKRAVELADIRYTAGTSTNLDLLDAQTGLLQAELTDLQASYDYVISTYVLRRVTGEKFW